MSAIVAGLAIGSAIAGIAGSVLSANSAESNNQRQIDWENYKLHNAHQVEVADLKEAGINPILTANSGGASGGALNLQQPDYSGISNLGSNVANALMAEKDLEVKDKQAQLLESQKQNTDADTGLKETQIDLNKEQKYQIKATTGLIKEQVKNTKQLTANGKAEMYKILAEIDNIKTDQDLKRITGDLQREQARLSQEMQSLVVEQKNQTKAQTKLIDIDKEIKSVRAQMKWVDYGLEKLGQVGDFVSDILPTKIKTK